MFDLNDLVENLKELSTDLKAISNNYSPKSKVDNTNLIRKISVFSDKETAKIMRFYSVNEWNSLTEDQKVLYKKEEEKRKLIITNEQLTEDLDKSVRKI